MKSGIITLILIVSASTGVQAQDIIKTRSGAVLRGKVTSVTATNVTYTAEGADTSVTLKIGELTGINYQNGTKDIFEGSEGTGNDLSTSNLVQMGRMDAHDHYRGFHSAKTLTTVVTALELPYGLIPAVACASTRPKEFNLDHMNSGLINNPIYRESYENEAYRIKKREVWKGFGNGFLIGAIFWGAIFSLSMIHY